MTNKQLLKRGIISENPIFFSMIGMCPTLAVTTSAKNGLGMGLTTTFVLVCSSIVISIIAKYIPDKVRIPSYIVVIASFVTVLQLLLQAYMPTLNQALGLFIPLIVVNCLVLARAEAFASKNNPVKSGVDALAMGLGFTFALTVLGIIREFFGNGTIFGFEVVGEWFPETIIFILPPGAFLTLGFILAFIKYLDLRKVAK